MSIFYAFDPRMVASALWDYGEDELIDSVASIKPRKLRRLQALVAHYENEEVPVPGMSTQRVTHNHVLAFAAIVLFEGQIRPLAQTRRRPQAKKPEHLRLN